MITICLFDLLWAVCQNMIPHVRYRPRCVRVSFVVLLLLMVYWLHSLEDGLSEQEIQATSRGGFERMFGNNLEKVLATYEPVLPRANNSTAVDAVWQIVSGTKSKFFVYSAYYERRVAAVRSVRVIGATTTRDSDPVWCRLWYNTEPPQSVSVLAQIKIIRENWSLPYSACFVLCPLGDGMIVPHSVSVVRFLHSPPANHLLVIDNYRQHKWDKTKQSVQEILAVCVQPLHTYNKAMNLIEFFELYAELGVDHFDLYNYNTDPTIDCVIQSYVAKGLVSYHSWDLEVIEEGGIWVHGIHAALNDCLYRNMYRYSNVAVVDLDEFIVPKQADSLVKLMKYMDTNLGAERNIGSYVFQNSFYFLNDSDDSSLGHKSIQSKLMTISKTKRIKYLNPHNQRSKYICKPERTVETGNHFVWEHLYGYHAEFVKPDVAVSQHYRFSNNDNVGFYYGKKTIFDNSAHRFKGRLTRRVLEKWTKLREQCGLQMLEDT